MRVLSLVLMIFFCAAVRTVRAEPTMPPLCTVRAEVVDRNEDDATLQLKVLEVHGLFSTLSCEGSLPEAGDVVKTLYVWDGDFAGIIPGCTLSAGIAPEDASVPDSNIRWKDVAVVCPNSKKVLQYPLSTEVSLTEKIP